MSSKAFNAVDGVSVGVDSQINVIDSGGNVTAQTLAVSISANFGSVDNLVITGGESGQFLQTDGSGNLIFADPTVSASGSNTQIQFNDDASFGASANLTFDKSTNTLVVKNSINIGGADSNISGANNVTANFYYGDGGFLSNISGVGSGNSITNGTSNVVVDANSNVRISVADTANVFVITATGANLSGNLGIANGNVTGANLITANSITIGNGTGGNLTGANVISANTLTASLSANLGNSVTSNFFIGDGGLLSNVTAATVTTNAQPNITSVGTLTSLAVTGNISTANLAVTGISNLNDASNVVITGGSSNQFLQTNGSGSLAWAFPGVANNVLYVSKSGNDSNGGTSLDDAKLTIASAIIVANQLQATTPTGTTIIFVKAGDYTETNPMSMSSGVSIVGDNLRTVTVRPSNRTKDIFWVRNRCYVTGMTFRDHLYPSAAIAFPNRTFTGSISGTTLTVTAISSPIDDIRVGMYVIGTGVATNTYITALGTGSGGTGTYTVNTSQSVGSTAMEGAEIIITSPYTQNASSITSKSLVNAGSFVTGYTYRIYTVGDTNYTLIGAASNTVGVEFTATGAGSGTGTAYTVVGCGMRVDGNFALGLKSMVLDSYTQFNSGGLGIHILNMGYAQLVSIFTICCTAGVKCESGGTCSISNSNNSFGDYGLWSDGTSPALYSGNLVSYTSSTATLSELSIRPAVNDALLITDGSNTQYLLVRESTPLVGNTSTITFVETLEFAPNTGNVDFYQISLIAASSQTFEYVGTGTDILTSTPRLGGIPIQENEVRETNGGRVNFTSTDQFGDFRIGSGLLISEEAGVIEGTTFDKSLFAVLTPYILALEG